MKKLVFTAIAVIAFSGVSMASTVEESEATACEDAAIDFYEVIIDGDADDIDLLNELLSYCD